MTSTIPTYRPDVYAPRAILDPYPHYAEMRALGAVVRLHKQRTLAVTRYADCKRVLLDDATFVSGQGVALNPVTNLLGRGTTLSSDGDVHDQRRKRMAHRLTPKALRTMRDEIDRRADETIAAAVARGHVDGVKDIAEALPTSFVPDLIGWPQEGRQHLLRWAGATFDSLGPFNARTLRTSGSSIGMLRFARSVVRREDMMPGSMGDDLIKKVHDGELKRSECPALMIDYLAPSLDTTISAIASMLMLLAQHPKQWDHLRSNPELVPNAVNEVVRIHSPLRAFTRVAVTDARIDDVDVPAGSRVVIFYASANRDERAWTDPDTFDVTRDASSQLGFGQGAHGCAGQGLARLEAQSILRSLLARVERIELTDDPVWGINNVIHKLDRLPLQLVASNEGIV
jgi:cytochrome P450